MYEVYKKIQTKFIMLIDKAMSKWNADFYSSENIPSSNWAKFSNVGDSVMGTFKEQFFKDGDGDMPSQEVFVLTNASLDKVNCDASGQILWLDSSEDVDGDINVGIKETNTFILSRLKNVQPWDIIWFAFVKEIPPAKKGYNPAKSITVFKKWVDEAYLKEIKDKKYTNKDPIDDISISDIPF